jgi:hypothetical protein
MQSVGIFFAIISLIAISAGTNAVAQGRFSINTSLAAVGGNLSDSSHNMAYYLYGSLRYQAQDYYLSLSLPLVFNSSGSFTQLGGMYIPNGNEKDTGGGMHGTGGQGSMMNGSDGMSSLNTGIGDMYFYGSYYLLNETNSFPGFSVDGFIKFPTASSSLNIGTGKFDFNVALSARKFIGSFLFFVQGGYLFLGNSSESNIENPITFSAGIGNNFGSGKHLFLLEYDSYSTIVTGFASPKQLSLGYTYFINPEVSWTTIGSAGLNSSTSDYIISVGLNFNL